jgi:hypothetical protein
MDAKDAKEAKDAKGAECCIDAVACEDVEQRPGARAGAVVEPELGTARIDRGHLIAHG